MLPVESNGRVYLYDQEGIPAGMLSGPVETSDAPGGATTSSVHPVSYVIRRDGRRSTLEMAWRDVDSVDLYEVRLNGDLLESTSQTNARVPLADLAVGDYISVDAIDREARQEESTVGTMGLIVSEFTMGAVSLDQAPAEADSFEVQAAVLPTSHYFRFTTFIPTQYAAIGFWEDLGCTVPSGSAYFGGDNRSFSYSGSTYRTRANVWWTWATTTQGSARYVGTTRVYNSSKILISSKTASTSGIQVSGPYPVNALEKRFHIRHAVGNPYCSSLSAIDYQIDMYVERTAGYNGFTASGKNDRAPNYEFYYDDNTISPVRFRGWAMTPNQFACLAFCTQATFSIVK